MGPVSARIAIDAPRERVFALLNDLSLRPAFTEPLLSEPRLARLDPVGPGASLRFRLRGTKHWMDTAIESVEPPHLVREAGRAGRLNRIPTHTVWELSEGPGPGGCELTLTFWMEPHRRLDRLTGGPGTRRRWRRGWTRSLRLLRELAEAAAPVERLEVAGEDRIPA